MAVALVPKKSTQAGYAPLPAELQTGELALNLADGALYTKLANGQVQRLNPSSDSSLQQAKRSYAINLILG
jgi:hypothetical protein